LLFKWAAYLAATRQPQDRFAQSLRQLANQSDRIPAVSPEPWNFDSESDDKTGKFLPFAQKPALTVQRKCNEDLN
jgi:hypothetical protein